MTFTVETPAGPADHAPFVDVHTAVAWGEEHCAECGHRVWIETHDEEEGT